MTESKHVSTRMKAQILVPVPTVNRYNGNEGTDPGAIPDMTYSKQVEQEWRNEGTDLGDIPDMT